VWRRGSTTSTGYSMESPSYEPLHFKGEHMDTGCSSMLHAQRKSEITTGGCAYHLYGALRPFFSRLGKWPLERGTPNAERGRDIPLASLQATPAL
jgi:hypothetical protein